MTKAGRCRITRRTGRTVEWIDCSDTESRPSRLPSPDGLVTLPSVHDRIPLRIVGNRLTVADGLAVARQSSEESGCYGCRCPAANGLLTRPGRAVVRPGHFHRPWESCDLLTRRCRGSVIPGSQYGGTWEVSPNDSARKLDQRRRVDGRALAVRNPAKPAATPEGTSRMTRHSPSGPHRNSREANSALFRSTHAAEAHTPPASVPPASSHLGNDPTRIRLQGDPVR
jgi:hypothetical protein